MAQQGPWQCIITSLGVICVLSDFVYINSGISHAPTKQTSKKGCCDFCKLCEFWLMKIWNLSSSSWGHQKAGSGPCLFNCHWEIFVCFFPLSVHCVLGYLFAIYIYSVIKKHICYKLLCEWNNSKISFSWGIIQWFKLFEILKTSFNCRILYKLG